jgi:tRNA modification GTPase
MDRTEEHVTWARLLTPPGVGAIAVIRVAGPEALRIAESLFESDRSRDGLAEDPQRLWYGRLVEGGEILDHVILAPRRTADPFWEVDISLHGGVWVVTRVLLALERRGACVASTASAPQTPLAWRAGHWIESEADEAMIRARTRRAVEALAWQRRHLPTVLRSIRDLARTDPAGASAALQNLRDGYHAIRLLVEGARVVVVGPPNAGKSALTNRLVGQEAALTGSEAGTTLDWTTHEVSIDGIPLTVVDTAGVHESGDALAGEAMDRGLRAAADADLVLAVLDGSRPVSAGVWRACRDTLRPGRWLAVVNKADLPAAWSPDVIPSGFVDVISVSAWTGEGLEGLRTAILRGLGFRGMLGVEPALFSLRQVHLVGANPVQITTDRVRALVSELLGEA